MQSKKILFLGYGDLAARTAAILPEYQKVGVARSLKPRAADVEFRQGGADSPEVLEWLAKTAFDAVVVTLTPAEHSAEAYARTYVETMKHLLPVWQECTPGLVVFVSSTSVYHQNSGEWVDEASPTQPDHFSGQILLQAESLLISSGLPVCIVRFAGIYGPRRDFLLRQVRAGRGGSPAYTNRIHAEDCAGVLAHLLRQHFAGKTSETIYLGCDSAPAPGTEVRRWLAEQIGVDPNSLAIDTDISANARGGNKRCSNRRLLNSGYNFLYPSYREGYGVLLDSGELDSSSGSVS